MEQKQINRNRWIWMLLLVTFPALLLAVGQRTGRAGDDPLRARGAVTAETAVAGSEQLVPATTTTTGPHYGIGFISAEQDSAGETRYQNALDSGATWNRWPIYWFNIEQEEGVFDWTSHDAAIRADLEHGLKLNAILLGSPYYDQTQDEPLTRAGTSLRGREIEPPPGLYEDVFTGGDVPGPDRQINEANRWARFVYKIVNRYRPGGILAQDDPTWPAGGVTVWEIWNEPDLAQFWLGSEADYARLLKVAYLAARHADPEAQIMVGGLAYFEEDGFFEKVLQVLDGDPMAPAYGYFHDMVGVHNYFHSWSSWYYVYRTALALDARGLDKEIWLNESGVPAWNDYPGPIWDPVSVWRATMTEQADFVVQSAFYATFAGADAIFHFQLYDGCGNQPNGTDFPPHDGELCEADGTLENSDLPCAGDAFGLYRNPDDAACFSQHPEPETPRPVFNAYKHVTTYLQNVEPLWRQRPGGTNIADAPQEWIAFYRPETGQRVLGLWARFSEPQTAVVPALAASATLVTPTGPAQTITPDANGNYNLDLPGATNQNTLNDPHFRAIGGRPFILVEKDEQPPAIDLAVFPFVRDGQLQLQWSGDDALGSGLRDFTLTVAVDGGSPTPWLANTTETQAGYPVELGKTYTFRLLARDRAGNVSAQAEVTRLAQVASEHMRLPLVFR